MSRAPHAPGCLCSNCHLSSKLFPRGPNDRIILPAIRPTPGMHDSRTEQAPRSPMDNDRARMAPPRPQSTAPGEYRPRHHAPPPMPPLPTSPRGGYGFESSSAQPHHPRPPLAPEGGYRFVPPERPASAMAGRPRHDSLRQPPPLAPEGPADPQQAPGDGTGLRLKWVKKKERVSHFTAPSQYQGTSYRQYVHDGVTRNGVTRN